MKMPRYLNRLTKSTGTRVLALMAVMLLTMEPYVYALSQIVSKYPTGAPVIVTVDMDATAGVNNLYYGSVFGFNSAKSMTQTSGYAEISEGACVPEGTAYTFVSGMEGWTGVAATNISYMYDSALGSGSIKTVLAKRNIAAGNFTWEKKFFYDCGTPTTATFAMKYSRGLWTSAGATNTFTVTLVKPDLTTKVLVNAATITATAMTTPTIVQPVTTDLTLAGTYTLRITGTLSTTNTNGAKVEVAFDDISLTKAPQTAYGSFREDVELTTSSVPLSATNNYTLEIRAKKGVGGENVNVWVYNGIAVDNGQGVGWVNRATISNTTHTDTSWTLVTDENYAPDYSLALSTLEYNGGNVRVRYIDAVPTADTTQDVLYLDYQRVKVDQGPCVDSVTNSTSDCGKCHNYNGNITKPWPDEGFHNKHAQTESISDCLWCHPSTGYTSSHSDGVIAINGSKIYEELTTPTNGGTGTYNPTNHTCATPVNGCHRGVTTPDWFSVEGVTVGFHPNCSRCHNSGTPGVDATGNLNIDVAWPNDAGQGHAKHDVAFNLDETSCQSSGSCHPDNRSQHTVVGDGIVEVKVASIYASPNKSPKYMPDTVLGTGTCVNMACHGGNQTPRFNLANTPAGPGPIDVTTNCAACHLAEKADGWGTGVGMASQWISPISGLHRGSPPTSGKSHIADYGCTACHNVPGKHFQNLGVSNLNTGTPLATSMDQLLPADFKAVVGYAAGTGTSPNYTTPPTCSNPAPTTGCHAESDPANKVLGKTSTWARKWSWDAYDTVTPANQCKNCHGVWTNFNAGVVQPHVTSNSDTILRNALINNHSESGNNCATMCHAQTDALYNHGVSMTASTKDMSLNTNAGIVRTGGPPDRVGCSFCHSANDGAAQGNIPDGGGPATNHIFAESNWLTDTANAGPTPVCYSGGTGCHGDGVSKSYPTGASYPNKAGKHDLHMTRLATKLAVTLPGTQAQQSTMCQYCHNTLSPGLAGHTTDATANQAEVTSFKKLNSGLADAGTLGTFSAADGSCSGIDCHNEQATGTTYGWRSAGTSNCVMCHTKATTGNNPSSGLHYGATAPTVTGKWHDNTLNGVTTDCLPCHVMPAYAAAGTHMNGVFTGNGLNAATDKVYMGLFSAYTATADGQGSCVGAAVGVGCHAGAGDAGTWARKWNSTFSYLNTGAECAGCHGGFTGSASWTTGVLNHALDWDGDTVANEIANKHGADDNTIASRLTKCQACHVYNDATNSTYVNNGSAKIGWKGNATNNSTYHGDGLLNFDGSRTYTLAGGCASSCHVSNTNHKPGATSGWTLNNIAGTPPLSCVGCHAGTGTGALKVGPASSHTDPDGTGATYTAGANNCAICHFTDHTARTTTTVGINWDNRTMGTNFTTDSKIYIKSNIGGTTVTTEAEICWRCHWGLAGITQPTLIKEFGTTLQGAYAPGSLNQGNWVGATWTSANFSSYKNGTIASVHQVQGVGTAPTFSTDPTIITTAPAVGNVATLGCTSCHDVHEVGNNGFTPTAAPYLRGSWTSNPFKEDGAPGGGGVSTWAFGTRSPAGGVPRGAAMSAVSSNNELGGWQIEQNNTAFANAVYSGASGYAGICANCHLQSTATVGLEAKWTGHKAAVSGFIGTGGANVFSSTVRGGTGAWTNANMGHQGSTFRSNSTYVGGLRNSVQYNDGILPKEVNSKPETSGVAISYFAGAVKTITMDGTTTQANFHNFPCSKCHSPHASRLPRLMITNCLDVKHNTWDDTKGNPSAWTATGQTYVAKQLAYSPTAGNCHRYVLGTDINREAAAETGWNSVTPW